MIICKKTNWCNRCCLAVFNTGNIFLALALSKKNLLNSANISVQTSLAYSFPDFQGVCLIWEKLGHGCDLSLDYFNATLQCLKNCCRCPTMLDKKTLKASRQKILRYLLSRHLLVQSQQWNEQIEQCVGFLQS